MSQQEQKYCARIITELEDAEFGPYYRVFTARSNKQAADTAEDRFDTCWVERGLRLSDVLRIDIRKVGNKEWLPVLNYETKQVYDLMPSKK